MTSERYDIVVVGAGPAGLGAVSVALEEGARVALIDDNPRPGGQIWRQGPAFSAATPLQAWLDFYERHAGLTLFSSTRVIAATTDRRLLVESGHASAWHLGYGSLILATGARELLLPFDGWTLPGVTGAGGLQALIKGGLDVEGERIVVAGSGPLLLASAATAMRCGARVVAVIEQAPRARVLRFGAGLIATPSKLVQAATLMRSLTGQRYRTDSVVTAAHGATQVESVTVRSHGFDETIACDRLATGYGLVPNVALGEALGCAAEPPRGVLVDADQRTSVERIFAAGECTGVGGMELARAEGALAAYAALGVNNARAAGQRRARARWRKFAARLARAFEPGDAALARPSADTIFCRCEDVTFADVSVHANWRDAKLQTRCGMGACQGRICGAAAQSLFGWNVPPARTPFSPARIETLMTASLDSPL